MKITNGIGKELRNYAGGVGVFVFVIGILIFLSYNEIPSVNKDVIVSIIGMIVGSLSVVIMTIIGRNPDEVNELKKQNEGLSAKVEHLIQQKDELEKLLGTNAFNTIYNKDKKCTCGNNECACNGE